MARTDRGGKERRLRELAGRQYNRVSRVQLRELGFSESAIEHRVASGYLVAAEYCVYAIAPALPGDWSSWMAATLTADGNSLSHSSAGAAWGFWTAKRDFETVTRPGRGGPSRHGSVLGFRSLALDGDFTVHNGVPITTVARTLIDLATVLGERGLARALREAVRLRLITIDEVIDAAAAHRGRRGVARLVRAAARFSGLPIGRARSGSEVIALQVIRDADLALPRLNHRIAGEEADLSWRPTRTIIEIDGGPFHQDRHEDARKTQAWQSAGWTVHRLPSTFNPPELLTLARPASSVSK